VGDSLTISRHAGKDLVGGFVPDERLGRAKEPNSSATNALIAALPPIPIRLVPSSLLHPSVTVPQRQLRLHQQGRRRTESEGIVADRWSSGMWMVLTAVAIVLLAAPQARADEKLVGNVP